MKNIFKMSQQTKDLIRILMITMMMVHSIGLLFSLGMSSVGLDLRDIDNVYGILIINVQLFLMLLIFLTIFIVIPRNIMFLIGLSAILPPISFFNYLDGGGYVMHIVLVLYGVMYIIIKFDEKDINLSEFWPFKGLSILLILIDLIITFPFFYSLNSTYLAPDLMHQIMISGLTLSMLIGLALIMVLLVFPIEKLWEYVIGFGLLFSSMMFLFNQKLLIGEPFLTITISLIFLSYITFFQNEKYHNL